MYKNLKLLVYLSLAAMIGFAACKTAEKRPASGSSDKEGSVTLNQSVKSKKDENGSFKLAVPKFPKTPPKGMTTEPTVKPSVGDNVSGIGLSGFGLADGDKPTTSDDIAQIKLRCFKSGTSNVVQDGWFFYASLEADGKEVKSYKNMKLNRCESIQVDLANLTLTKVYTLTAQFFWRSEDGEKTIVYHEGKTSPFNPSDADVQLVLDPLIQKQEVEIIANMTPKQKCEHELFLWNGKRCLNGEHYLVFNHSDRSDYSKVSSEDTRKRKCLHFGADGKSVQYDCQFSSKQKVLPRMHGSKPIVNPMTGTTHEYWFTLQTDDNKCLTVVKDDSRESPYLKRQKCERDSLNSPPANQLFFLVETIEGDEVGRNNYRIASHVFPKPEEALCIGVPIRKTDVSQVVPQDNNSHVNMIDCNLKDRDEKLGQYLKIIDLDDQ